MRSMRDAEARYDQILSQRQIAPPRVGAKCALPSLVCHAGGHQREVQRPDAQGAAFVEAAEIIGFLALGMQNARNEKPGEYKEQVHPRPAAVRKPCDRRVDQTGAEMIENDQNNRYAAYAIETRDIGELRFGPN